MARSFVLSSLTLQRPSLEASLEASAPSLRMAPRGPTVVAGRPKRQDTTTRDRRLETTAARLSAAQTRQTTQAAAP
eukprot:11430348-Heterocapsa_arctica.AAC.1